MVWGWKGTNALAARGTGGMLWGSGAPVPSGARSAPRRTHSQRLRLARPLTEAARRVAVAGNWRSVERSCELVAGVKFDTHIDWLAQLLSQRARARSSFPFSFKQFVRPTGTTHVSSLLPLPQHFVHRLRTTRILQRHTHPRGLSQEHPRRRLLHPWHKPAPDRRSAQRGWISRIPGKHSLRRTPRL